MRGLLRRIERMMNVMRSVDERDVGQGLREIARLTPRRRIVFLRQQSDIIGDGCDALEQFARLVDIAGEDVDVGEPQGAGKERAFVRERFAGSRLARSGRSKTTRLFGKSISTRSNSPTMPF